MMTHHQVIIVGAGPGGLAVAASLKDHGFKDVVILEKGVVGQAWLDYPAETHLLSETATSHDDNMIAGIGFGSIFPNIPHPSHTLYQRYLEEIVLRKQLLVKPRHKVKDIVFHPRGKRFIVQTNQGDFSCQFLVWSGGMYSTPNEQLAGHTCYTHYAKISDFASIAEEEITVVGSANGASGVVMELARPGRRITLISSHPYTIPQPIDCLWKENMQFVQNLEQQGLVKIVENFRVVKISKCPEGYRVESNTGESLVVPHKPIVCIGFLPNTGPVAELVDEVCVDHDTRLDLDEDHQSLKQPGLYFAGVTGKLQPDHGTIMYFREFGEKIVQSIQNHLKEHKN